MDRDFNVGLKPYEVVKDGISRLMAKNGAAFLKMSPPCRVETREGILIAD